MPCRGTPLCLCWCCSLSLIISLVKAASPCHHTAEVIASSFVSHGWAMHSELRIALIGQVFAMGTKALQCRKGA